MEFTAFRRIDGGGNIPFQNHSVHLHVRIRHGYCREQRFRIRVQRIVENTFFRAVFYHIPKIHNPYFVGNMLDDGQIVRNEYVRKPKFLFQFFKHINDLRLNRYVECGNGFVANDEIGFQRKRAGYTDTLSLPARKFVRVTIEIMRLQSARLQHL